MMKMAAVFFGATLGAAAVFSVGAEAAVIPVANASFEILPPSGLPFGCGTGCSYSSGPIPGWVDTGGGQFQPGSSSGNLAISIMFPTV